MDVLMEKVKTINHLGQVVYQESVEFYKENSQFTQKNFFKIRSFLSFMNVKCL
ncbi:putative transcriptional regulator [Lactococcus lactis]|uniref:putative transcriptional regulator n=1 Tax=Lactococcus lactis TaxID=1358 RepID=UPI003866E4BA